jgi:hypothetical protein
LGFRGSRAHLTARIDLSPNSAERTSGSRTCFRSEAKHEQAVAKCSAPKTRIRIGVAAASYAIVLRKPAATRKVGKIQRALSLYSRQSDGARGLQLVRQDLGNTGAEESFVSGASSERPAELPLYAYGYTLAVAESTPKPDESRGSSQQRRAKQYVPPIFLVLIYTSSARLIWLSNARKIF